MRVVIGNRVVAVCEMQLNRMRINMEPFELVTYEDEEFLYTQESKYPKKDLKFPKR
jgi:hypothetical protein